MTVLVDFGDGVYRWADIDLPPSNVTALRATELANATWGLPPMNVSWFDSPFCVRRPCAFVNDLGDRRPVYPEWWHLYLWNASSRAWQSSSLGPSDMDLEDGAAIAWYLAVDDPATLAAPTPVPTPGFREVYTSFRGDLRNTGAARGGIPVSSDLSWSRSIDPGAALPVEIDTTPVLAYGMVYVGLRSRIAALRATDGTVVWEHLGLGALLSTPAIYDGHLVVGGTDGRLHYLDAFSGEEVWNVTLETGVRSTGIASSPAVHRGRAYLGTFNESGGFGRIAAVNLNNGTVAWTFETSSVHMSQPAIADENLYVGVMGMYDGVVGYNPPYGLLSLTLDGRENWFFRTNGSVASSPVLAGDLVVFTTKDGFLYALRTDGRLAWERWVGPSTSTPAFARDLLFVAAGGLNASGGLRVFDLAGSERWQVGLTAAVQASVLTDGRLVCVATNTAASWVACHLVADGRPIWSRTLTPEQYVLGSPVVVGDTMYAVSDAGIVYAMRTSQTPLLDLSMFAPTITLAGRPERVTVDVNGTERGRATNVTLIVEFPAGLRRDSEPVEAAREARTLRLSLSDVGPFDLASYTFDVVPMAGYGVVDLTVRASHADLDGKPRADAVRTARVLIQDPPPGPPVGVWAAAIVVAGVSAGAICVVVLARGRRRGPDNA